MTAVLTLIGGLVVIVPAFIALFMLWWMWEAWWLYPAWGWFMVPMGLPAISFWHFTALIFLLGTLTQHVDTKKDERKTEWATLAVAFIWPIAAWGMLRWMR